MIHTKRRFATLVVALVSGMLTLSGCSIYDVPLPGGPDTGKNPMTVKVLFRDVLDLVPQSTVKVNDVTVGKVAKVELKGYIAEVTVTLPRNIDLPDNATAQIRQTSLLGEKFVSLAPPEQPGSGKLADKDVIGLDRTGRNPEVEEVLGALSLLLNGGGVGQLKTITEELNTAFSGRESDVRSVLDQIRIFVSQLDANKQSIVTALENTNRLAGELRQQDGTIKSALDDIPAALRSINGQRADLVKLLKALTRLSGVGVRVIKASKESTINSLRDLAPVLAKFAEAGQSLPKSLQVFLTYPFVDDAVGRNPQVARNLHMGDYTNLSVNLDIDVANLPKLPALPTGPVCAALAQVLDTTRNNVNTAVNRAFTALPQTPLITQREKRRLRRNLTRRILNPALAQAKAQCKAPDVGALTQSAGKLLPALLDTLNILTPSQVKQLVAGTLGTGGTALNNLTGGATGGVTGGLGLNPRAQLGKDYQKPTAIDPFGLVRYGLDPGIGTMLLQGVADVR